MDVSGCGFTPRFSLTEESRKHGKQDTPVFPLLLLFLYTEFSNALVEPQQSGSRKHKAGGKGRGRGPLRTTVEQLVQSQHHHLVQLIETLLLLQLEGLRAQITVFLRHRLY